MGKNRGKIPMQDAAAVFAAAVALGALAFFWMQAANAPKTPGEIAAEKINAKIAECDRLVPNEMAISKCTEEYLNGIAGAATSGDEACPYVGGVTDRMRNSEFCYFEYLASLHQRYRTVPGDYCVNVSSAWARESCLTARAVFDGNSSLCEGITNSSYRENCKYVVNATGNDANGW